MEVRLHRSIKGGGRWPTRYSLRSPEGSIATSGNILDLIELADEDRWVVDCATEQVYDAYVEAALS